MKNKSQFQNFSESGVFYEDSQGQNMLQNTLHNWEPTSTQICGNTMQTFDLTQTQDINKANGTIDTLDWCAAILHGSPTGLAMLREFDAQGWQVDLADLESTDFTIDLENKIIELNNYALDEEGLQNSAYFKNSVLISMIHALRDVWQEKRFADVKRNYKPEDILMMERVRAADSNVVAVLVAWELRNEGHGDIWRHILGCEDGDIALSFSQCLDRAKLSISTGENFFKTAMIHAFRQWFKNDERVNNCDRESLNYIDDMMKGRASQAALDYQNLSPTRLEILSCLPSKTAYLWGMGANILRNPEYAGLKSEINQTHLFHIVYDLRVTYKGGVPFRDADLAAKFFPDSDDTCH